MSYYLNETTNASTSPDLVYRGGDATFSVQGTFDSATVTLNYKVPGGALYSAFSAGTTVTTAVNTRIAADEGVVFQIVVSGGLGSVDLEIYLGGVAIE